MQNAETLRAQAVERAAPEPQADGELVDLAAKTTLWRWCELRSRIPPWQCALERAAPKDKADREFVLHAVQHHGREFEHAAPELRADRGFIVQAVRRNEYVLSYAAKLEADRWVFHEAACSSIAAKGSKAPIFSIQRITKLESGGLEVVVSSMSGDGLREIFGVDSTLGDVAKSLVKRHGRCEYVYIFLHMPGHSDVASPLDHHKRLANLIGA